MAKITRRQLLTSAALVACYPFFVERHLIFTNHYRIPVPNLPKSFAGFRIVQITDIHHGPITPLSFVEQLVHKVNAMQRDMVVCTGDFVDRRHMTSAVDEVWPVISKLTASLGVYSVLGNHDHAADTERSQYWLERSGQNLRHQVKSITRNGERLWLVGAGDHFEDHRPLDKLLKQVPENDCRIVLAHNPDTADTEFTSRIDLMISGHTHGGQVVIPFIGPLVLPVKNRNYVSGLETSKRGLPVFISRGIGSAGLPVRLNCPPEIAVLELVKS